MHGATRSEVFTSVPPGASAPRTPDLVTSLHRSAMDSSAADITWACAPHMSAATSAQSPPLGRPESRCRSRRRARTCDQVHLTVNDLLSRRSGALGGSQPGGVRG